jgi:1,2-diacylglycerol 3-beta-glucosyltransferase
LFNLTFANYFIAAVVAYYGFLLLVAKLRRRGLPAAGTADVHFVLIVPARNEELVIEKTLANLAQLDSDGHWVLVMNDGSSDATGAIAQRVAMARRNIWAVDRGAEEAGRGKSDVLNHAARLMREALEREDSRFEGWQVDDVVIGIVDADGRLEEASLRAVSPYFADAKVASVQVGVRIGNAGDGLLARMQDMEFVGFTYLVQIARDHFGSSGLGGNGQFTRLAALSSVGPQPWAPGALTEDLDLGLSLVEKGWQTRFCPETFVSQQGLNRWRPLLRQRTRWIHGHYQCWRHLPRLLTARNVAWRTRLDLMTYLLLVVTVVVVTYNLLLTMIGLLGLVAISNNFLSFVPDGYSRAVVAEIIALFPLVIFMHTYQRHSGRPFRWYELPAAGAAFTVYSYVWVISTLRAWTRMATRRGSWTKTPRVSARSAEAR